MTDETGSATSQLATAMNLIERAAKDAKRNPNTVTLVCVTKTQVGEIVEPLIDAGQKIFGENRVQEAAAKWPRLKQRFPDIELHLIGPLQTNKVREALGLFDVIETLDRHSLARTIAKEIARTNTKPGLYVQVNTGREPQKSGIAPSEADGFLAECRRIYGLQIAGLMCIPPVGEQVSPHFALLAQIADRNGIGKLSMGMSGDFELAIQMGATHVRLGSAIFGQRRLLSANSQTTVLS